MQRGDPAQLPQLPPQPQELLPSRLFLFIFIRIATTAAKRSMLITIVAII